MRFFQIPLLLLSLCSHPIFSQSLTWSKQIGDTSNQTLAAFKVDGDGAMILFGSYRTYPEAGSRPAKGGTRNHLFLHKLDSTGATVWFRHIGSSYTDDRLLEMDIDREGNIYILGYLSESIECRSQCILTSTGTDTVSLDPAGDRTFIARYSTAGKVEWLKQFAWETEFHLDFNPDLNVADGKVFVYGFFRNALGFHGETQRIPGDGENRGFFATIDADGTDPRLTVLDSVDHVSAVEADAAGNLYLGYVAWNGDVVIRKSDSLGAVLWEKILIRGAPSSGETMDRVFLDDAGNIYVSGLYSYTAVLPLDNGKDSTVNTTRVRENVLGRYTPDGRQVWVKSGTDGGSWFYSGFVAPDGSLYYTDAGSYRLFRVRPDGTGNAWPDLPLGHLHLDRNGTLTAARPLAQFASAVLGKPFTSAGKQDILLLKVDLAGVTAARRPPGRDTRWTGEARFTPLGRRLPEHTASPVPAYPPPTGRH